MKHAFGITRREFFLPLVLQFPQCQHLYTTGDALDVQEEYLRMGLPETVADSLSKPRAPCGALARDFALAFLNQEKQLLLRTAELNAVSAEIRSLNMRYLSTRHELSIRGVIGALCVLVHGKH